MKEVHHLLLGLILHLVVISESRVIEPRGLSDDRLSIDEGMPILLDPLEKDKEFNAKPSIGNHPTEDDEYFNAYDYDKEVNDHNAPPSDSDYNEYDEDINKVDNNLPGTKPERFPFDSNDKELDGKPREKNNRDKLDDEDKPILKFDDEGDIDTNEPDEDYSNKEHKPENEGKLGEGRKDEEEKPEPEDEEKLGDERKDEDEEHKPVDKENTDEEEKNEEPEDEEKPNEEKKDEEELESEDEEEIDETEGDDDEEKKGEEEALDSEDEEKIDETKGDNDEKTNVPEETIDDGDKEDEVPKEIDEESLDKENDYNDDKGIHEGGEEGFFSGGSIFDTPFFNLEQVKKYFSKLDRALGHVFRQTLDEANLLNGTYANTTEEEVEIDGKKYIITKSVIKGSDNHSSLYVESLSTKPKANETEVIKDIEIRNASHT